MRMEGRTNRRWEMLLERYRKVAEINEVMTCIYTPEIDALVID